jgi:uncharacterized protein YcgI (DUF1989 family)
MPQSHLTEIAGGSGGAVVLTAGEAIRLVNSFGTQVVDTWALNRRDITEYLSVEHTRRMLFNLFPRQGDKLFSNRRTPMLLLERDSSGVQHDMLFACCDPWLYRHYGCAEGHANCRDNFHAALRDVGVETAHVPNPLNLWMNIPVAENSKLAIEPPVSRAGDFVVLRALIDCIVIFSACPMDVTPINGPDCRPKPVHYERLPAN